MKPIKTVVIVGLGAIGAIYAEKLRNQSNVELFVLVDEARKRRYEKNGIMYNGKRYDFTYILPSDTHLQADLIIVATKSHVLHTAIEMMEHIVGKDTIILSLMNGISSERLIGERYGMEHILYAMYLGHGSKNMADGITHDGVNRIFFGDTEGNGTSDKEERCKEFFDRTGIDYIVSNNILHELWRKFMIIVGLNQASVLLQSNYGVYQKQPSAVAFAEKLMLEVKAIAEALGIEDTDRMLKNALAVVDQLPAETTASIYQDYQMKRPMEVDIFSGEICRLGRELNIPTPYNDVVNDVLSAINEKHLMEKDKQ
jgi:2-dehydropantoate 2-reductase